MALFLDRSPVFLSYLQPELSAGGPALICYNIAKPDKARNDFISAPAEVPVSTKMDGSADPGRRSEVFSAHSDPFF